MKLVYIACPLTAPTEFEQEENYMKAEKIALAIWGIPGLVPVCPYFTSRHSGVSWDTKAGVFNADKMIAGDLATLSRCDIVLMAPGWGNSKGANIERSKALELGIPVYYWPAGESSLQAVGLAEARSE